MKKLTRIFMLLAHVTFFQTTFAQYADREYFEPGFYSKLFMNQQVKKELPGEIMVWTLNDAKAQTDTQLHTFRPELLNDSIEIKYAQVVKQSTFTDTRFRMEKGKAVKTIEYNVILVVGIRFIKNNYWVSVTDTTLMTQYLAAKNSQLATRYKKHLKHREPTAGFVGIAIVGGGIMLDGFLLFGWHPYFIPVYAVGGAATLVGFAVHAHHGTPRAFKKIVDDYNRIT